MATAATAAGQDPDWPCIQRLVPRISPAQIWSGPVPDPASWEDDAEVRRLASKIAARRTPIEEADKLIGEFAESLGTATTAKDRLVALFGRTLEIINNDRASLIAGIKRYTQSQRALAERIRDSQVKLRQEGLPQEQSEALAEALHWETRIYTEREQSMTYLCEQPVLLEQRAFALGNAIGRRLDE